MRGNLWDDPRIGRICDLAGVKEATAIGALYWLWAAADQHTHDGRMPGLSMQQIDRKTGVKGFAAALVDVSWLADDPSGVVILHFEEHNGASAKKRSETAKRVAKHRAGNVAVTQKAENGNAKNVTGALARDREEIEKEKNKDKAGAVGGGEAAAPAHDEFPASPAMLAAVQTARQAGYPDVSVGDPLLRALVAQGLGADELRAVCDEGIRKRKGWGWVIAAAEGKRADAAALVLTPKAAIPWHESGTGIVAKGEELGLGGWTEAQWAAGGEPFHVYKAKVYKAAGHEERA